LGRLYLTVVPSPLRHINALTYMDHPNEGNSFILEEGRALYSVVAAEVTQGGTYLAVVLSPPRHIYAPTFLGYSNEGESFLLREGPALWAVSSSLRLLGEGITFWSYHHH